MSESYVYIDAPSLDNSDVCKFYLYEDFKYVSTAKEDNNDKKIAKFPLYEKFLSTGTDLNDNYLFNSSLDLEGLTRITIKEGMTNKGVSQNGDPDGGDYFEGNCCVITSKVFKIGEINKIKIKAFADSNGTPVSNTFWQSSAPRIAIFSMQIENGKVNQDLYDFVTYANFTNIDPNDGFGIYDIDLSIKKFLVSGEMLTTPRHAFCFVVLKSEQKISEEHKIAIDYQGVKKTYGIKKNYGSYNILLRGVPRGSNDNVSLVSYSSSTTSGRNDWEIRLLDFDFSQKVDLIDEYIGANSKNHHLTTNDVKNLNSLRYTAPAQIADTNIFEEKMGVTPWINNPKEGEKEDKKGWVKISHNSLTRGNNFYLNEKTIYGLQIPLELPVSAAGCISQGAWNAIGAQKDGFINTNREILIALDEDENGNPKNWVPSDDFLRVSMFKGRFIYEITFNNYNNIDHLRYKGKGIYISARMGKFSNGNYEEGNFNFPFLCWKNKSSEKFWTYPGSENLDYVHFNDYREGEEYDKLYMTPNINVIFDYNSRNEWFNYIEKLLTSHIN